MNSLHQLKCTWIIVGRWPLVFSSWAGIAPWQGGCARVPGSHQSFCLVDYDDDNNNGDDDYDTHYDSDDDDGDSVDDDDGADDDDDDNSDDDDEDDDNGNTMTLKMMVTI